LVNYALRWSEQTSLSLRLVQKLALKMLMIILETKQYFVSNV